MNRLEPEQSFQGIATPLGDTPDEVREPADVMSQDELQRRVMQERLAIAYGSLQRLFQVIVFSVLTVSLLIWTPSNTRQVLTWCSIALTVALFRRYSLRRFQRMSETQRVEKQTRLLREYIFGAALGGASWGLLAVLLWDPTSATRSLLIVMAILGICSGNVVTLAAFREASIIFITTAMGLLASRLMFEGFAEYGRVLVLSLVYVVLVCSYAIAASRTLIEGLEMKLLRGRAEEVIRRQALYDELTGLPNRRLLQDRLSQFLARMKRQEKKAALLFLDLDYFKRVNDSLGHSVGDELLREVAVRMRMLLRPEDTAARLGGDEFVALITDLDDDHGSLVAVAQRRAEELRAAIEHPINIRNNEIHITVSIGISILDPDTDNVNDLLKHADTAMYRAKEDGRNLVRFFETEMQEALAQRIAIENALRRTLKEKKGLSLYLQPQYDENREIRGAELLLRWRHEDNFIAPKQFIPIAEDCGLIYELGDWVIDEACAIGARLRALFPERSMTLALNVSPRQFQSREFTSKVLSALETHALPEGLIELEITEGLLVENVDDAVSKISELRGRGVRFSIDDFGTGYSSLSYLKSLPVDSLKIDKSFVRDALDDPGDADIVRAIVSMAKTFNLDVIAEGVETEGVQSFLLDIGCRRFQGFLYNRPMPLDQFLDLLRGEAESVKAPVSIIQGSAD